MRLGFQSANLIGEQVVLPFLFGYLLLQTHDKGSDAAALFIALTMGVGLALALQVALLLLQLGRQLLIVYKEPFGLFRAELLQRSIDRGVVEDKAEGGRVAPTSGRGVG